MNRKTVTETHIGNTLFVVTSECSPNATEAVEKKLERMICRHFSDTKSYQTHNEIPLAMYANKSEHSPDKQ